MNFKKKAKKTDPDFALVKAILKNLGIKYQFNWTKGRVYYNGYAKPEEGLIVVFGRQVVDVKETHNGNYRFIFKPVSKEEMLETIFHEIQHVLMYRKKEFLTYHSMPTAKTPKYSVFMKWAKELLPAERTADKRGKKMMKRAFPKACFKSVYSGKRGRFLANNTIHSYAQTLFPKKLKEIQKLYPIW